MQRHWQHKNHRPDVRLTLIYVVFVEQNLVMEQVVHFGNAMVVHSFLYDVIHKNIKIVLVSIECVIVRVCSHNKFAIKKWFTVFDKFAHDVCQLLQLRCVQFTIQWPKVLLQLCQVFHATLVVHPPLRLVTVQVSYTEMFRSSWTS